MACFCLSPGPVLAQNPPAAPVLVQGAVPDSTPRRRSYSAGGAFLRSMAVPGWGQVAVGSPNRGGFYLVVESLSAWMILKTSKTLGSARDIVALREAEAEARFMAQGTVDLLELQALIDEDEAVLDARELEEIRGQQKQDWVAFGVFFLFLGGADAFVAAHLADFPEPLEAKIRPRPGMGVELAFSLSFDPFRR